MLNSNEGKETKLGSVIDLKGINNTIDKNGAKDPSPIVGAFKTPKRERKNRRDSMNFTGMKNFEDLSVSSTPAAKNQFPAADKVDSAVKRKQTIKNLRRQSSQDMSSLDGYDKE